MGNTQTQTSERYEGRVRADGKLAARVSIVCRWVETLRGFEVSCRNMEPKAGGEMRPWHRVKIDFGKLVCNCDAYTFSRYSKDTPKTCGHLTGNHGDDGVAGWLELQEGNGRLLAGQVTFLKASRNDPHRKAARLETMAAQLQSHHDEQSPAETEMVAVGATSGAAAPAGTGGTGGAAGNLKADASRGVTLEQLFQNY